MKRRLRVQRTPNRNSFTTNSVKRNFTIDVGAPSDWTIKSAFLIDWDFICYVVKGRRDLTP